VSARDREEDLARELWSDLAELRRHAEGLKQKPSEWMLWNYRGTLARPLQPRNCLAEKG
jgi:hypothetical protein